MSREMTSKLEKQFFDMFGIEPMSYCCYHDCNCPINDVGKFNSKCPKQAVTKECDMRIIQNPQITDRILLELIRIIGLITIKYTNEQCEICYGDGAISYFGKDLKEAILNFLISKVSIFKQQVRAIFEKDN